MTKYGGLLLFALACLAATFGPAWRFAGPTPQTGFAFPGWPTTFEGQPLQECPLNAVERAFNEAFPGRMGRFTDGTRLIVLRWVIEPTHRVHSGAVCLQAAGFRLTPGDWRRDPDGSLWSTWTAVGPTGTQSIRERCLDVNGRSWPDVSSWYWAAITGKSEGPWWVVTVAEPRDFKYGGGAGTSPGTPE